MKKIISLLSLFSFLFFLSASFVSAQLNFYFVNVGMGNATYIELPNGQNALIDGGPSVKPIEVFLKSKNITHLDHVVLTHPHSDHYMGLKKVFKIATVSHFYDTKCENPAAQGDNNIREMARAQGSFIHFPRIGEYLNWDSTVNIRVLNTCETPVSPKNNGDINNCSIVLKFTYGGQKILLPGDLEEPGERLVMSRFPASELQADVLEPGHHGSKTASSQAFLNAVKPKIAILSYGTNNKYGFPHYEVVTKLQAMKVLMYSTNEQTQTMFLKPATRNYVEAKPTVKPYDVPLPTFTDYAPDGEDEVVIPMFTDEQKAMQQNKMNRTMDMLNNFSF